MKTPPSEDRSAASRQASAASASEARSLGASPRFSRPRSPGARTALLILLLAWLVMWGRLRIYSDGVAYFATCISLAQDGDFDLANQRYLLDTEWRAVAEFSEVGGRTAAIYSGGTAILNFPFLWPMVRLHDDLGFLKSLDALGVSIQGVPFAYTIAVLAASFVYLCLGTLCTYEVARRCAGDWWAALATAAVVCSLPVAMLGVWEPSYAHTGDFFLIAAALWLTVRLAEDARRVNLHLVLIAGALSLAAFVRVLNVVLFLPWGVYFVWFFARRGEGAVRILGRAAVFTLGALPFAALLVYYNIVSYGSATRTAYHLQPGWMVTHYPLWEAVLLWGRNVAYRFIHPRTGHGLFIWAPACALSLLGLALRERKGPRPLFLRELCLWGLAVPALVMGLWMVRGNRGLGVGPRLFIESAPFLAAGLAMLLGRARKGRGLLGAVTVVFTLYAVTFLVARMSWRAIHRLNLLLERQYHYPYASWHAYTPFQLLWAVVDDSQMPDYEPSRGAPVWSRLIRGAQPSAVYMASLALRGGLPVVLAPLEGPTFDRAGERLTVRLRLDRPARPGTRLAFDLFEFIRRDSRRGRRWGRFVSEPLPPDTTEAAFTADFQAGSVELAAGGRPLPIEYQRMPDNHRDMIRTATDLYFQAVVRQPTPTLLDQPEVLTFPNPFRGKATTSRAVTRADAHP